MAGKLVGAAALSLVFWLSPDWGQAAALTCADPLLIWAAFVASMLNVLILAGKWQWLLRRAGIPLVFDVVAQFYWIGVFFSNFLTTGVGAVQLMLTPARNQLDMVAGTILIEPLSGLLVMLLSALGLAILPLGRVDEPEPDARGCEVDESEETLGDLVVARRHRPKLLELVHQPFDGLIANDKFCLVRPGRLLLSWWRYPLRRRDQLPERVGTVPDTDGDRGGAHAAPMAGPPPDAAGRGRGAPVGPGLPAGPGLEPNGRPTHAPGAGHLLPASAGGKP